MTNKELSNKLHDIGAIKFGEFILKSGVTSPIYLDLRIIPSYPQLLKDISTIILDRIPSNVNRVCGVPYAALPLATVVSQISDLPLLIKRKEVKDYGTKKLIEGVYDTGDRIVLLEDVITSGESLIEVITELESVGLVISKIITIVDREQGGIERIKSLGYDIESILTISTILNSGILSRDRVKEIMDYLNISSNKLPKNHKNSKGQKLLDIAWRKKSNIIASIDLTKSDDILTILDNIGHRICAVKLHVDIIEDFDWGFIERLLSLSMDRDFMIIEDRKFADIGNTQIMQISKGIYRISEWADFITTHLISGESSYEAYKNWVSDRKPALIPILEMSSSGALTGLDYIKSTKNFFYRYSEIVGLVSQEFEVGGGLLKFTPGINLIEKGDDMGQQYRSPEWAINSLGSHFLIIGRGLYQSLNPLEELEKYISSVSDTGLFG